MSKASLRQAGAVLRLIDEAEWDSALVQTFVGNWGSIRDLTVALHNGRLTPGQIKAVAEGRFEIVESTEENPETAPAIVFPVWKTITLGLNKDPATYLAALQAGYMVGDYANQILEKTPIAAAEIVVDLVRVTVREMGFPQGATTTKIYAWAEAHGLKKCPAEVGPAFRLAYADQPFGEWIRVGMEPIAGSDGYLRVFHLGHDDDGRWLGTHWTHPANQWIPEDVWVFVRSQPAAASPQAMLAGKQ